MNTLRSRSRLWVYTPEDVGLDKLDFGLLVSLFLGLLFHEVAKKSHTCIFVLLEIETVGLSYSDVFVVVV